MKKYICQSCHGDGKVVTMARTYGYQVCPECAGRGDITCPECDGDGETSDEIYWHLRCSECEGKGFLTPLQCGERQRQKEEANKKSEREYREREANEKIEEERRQRRHAQEEKQAKEAAAKEAWFKSHQTIIYRMLGVGLVLLAVGILWVIGTTFSSLSSPSFLQLVLLMVGVGGVFLMFWGKSDSFNVRRGEPSGYLDKNKRDLIFLVERIEYREPNNDFEHAMELIHVVKENRWVLRGASGLSEKRLKRVLSQLSEKPDLE